MLQRTILLSAYFLMSCGMQTADETVGNEERAPTNATPFDPRNCDTVNILFDAKGNCCLDKVLTPNNCPSGANICCSAGLNHLYGLTDCFQVQAAMEAAAAACAQIQCGVTNFDPTTCTLKVDANGKPVTVVANPFDWVTGRVLQLMAQNLFKKK
jgi:hypothetical protein